MENTQPYIDLHKNNFLNELLDFLHIPSISADSRFKNDIEKAALFLKQKLEMAGADKVLILPTLGHPVVYAEKVINSDLPTVLIYGHYDVQPPDPLELWDSPPFEPVIKNEKIYARGACDDKGQVYMHIKALEAMVKTNTLACNVKFLIEGEEEIGSVHLQDFIIQNKERLKSDVIIISDTSIIANDVPSITVGLRGLSYVEIEVTGPNRDLHSGVYGGAVANPINILCEMITSLKDQNNRITIPGFYDSVEELKQEERENLAKAPFNLEEYKRDLGIQDVHGEIGYSTNERASIRPSLDVNGIWGGYIGEGAKTVLPSKAYAKISMRLVPNQSSEKIIQLFKKHFEGIAPKSVKVVVRPHHGGDPVITPANSIAYQAAFLAMKETFGKEPIPVRSGGSIPIVALFDKELQIPTVLMGFGLDTDAIHSPNEHFGIFNFLKGIETIPLFFKNFYTLQKK